MKNYRRKKSRKFKIKIYARKNINIFKEEISEYCVMAEIKAEDR